jgi:hypothetical protein
LSRTSGAELSPKTIFLHRYAALRTYCDLSTPRDGSNAKKPTAERHNLNSHELSRLALYFALVIISSAFPLANTLKEFSVRI